MGSVINVEIKSVWKETGAAQCEGGGPEKNKSEFVRKVSIVVEIWTQGLPDAKQDWHNSAALFGLLQLQSPGFQEPHIPELLAMRGYVIAR